MIIMLKVRGVQVTTPILSEPHRISKHQLKDYDSTICQSTDFKHYKTSFPVSFTYCQAHHRRLSSVPAQTPRSCPTISDGVLPFRAARPER
jgi:hypothetical protein